MISLEADSIMSRARNAQPAWAALTVSRRCRALTSLRRRIANDCESIAKTIAQESQKPLLDALSGDVMVTLEMLRYYQRHAPKLLRPSRIRKPALFFRGAHFQNHFEPHGVALVFGPSNYPFQLSMVPLITALIAGNAVIVKVSERTPATAALIAKLCAETDLPANLVQVLHGTPDESIALIDARPDIVFFTGSSRNGRKVAERAAAHLIPTILELGGKDAALVFADCNLERAVEGIAYGAFSNAGRVCVGTKRVYVEESIYGQFVLRMRRRMADLQVNTGPDADLCPLPDHEAILLRDQIQEALTDGAKLEWPPHPAELGSEPVLLSDVPRHAHLMHEETFGPVLCIAPFRNESHAVTLANDSAFALSGSVWTRDRARAQRIARTLSAGSCAVNDVIRVIANPYAAFGGNNLSGHGRYHGPDGLRVFSRSKTVMMMSDRRKREINWFPSTARTRRQLAMLLRLRHGRPGLSWRLVRGLLALMVAASSSLALTAQPKSETHLTINVRLTPNAHGELGYLVFNAASGFPADPSKAIRHGFLPITPGAHQMRINVTLPPGTYAVSVYEDLNRNHRLDHNLLGIPREPVGASNNPAPRMGPPRFDDCSFNINGKTQDITISLVPGI